MDAFAIGGLLAIFARSGARTMMAAAAKPTALVAATLLLFLGITNYGFDHDNAQMSTWGYSVAAIFFGAFLVLAISSKIVSRALETQLLQRFGQYSYAIYLFHSPAWTLLSPYLPEPTLLVRVYLPKSWVSRAWRPSRCSPAG
jgi:peptidoglycan/LPS O-acetylase OafA/YrhL